MSYLNHLIVYNSWFTHYPCVLLTSYMWVVLLKVAEYLSDPLCRGIFAGDTRLLSLKSCFPPVHQYESQHGSIIKGAFFTKEGTFNMETHDLWSFKQEHIRSSSLSGWLKVLFMSVLRIRLYMKMILSLQVNDLTCFCKLCPLNKKSLKNSRIL